MNRDGFHTFFAFKTRKKSNFDQLHVLKLDTLIHKLPNGRILFCWGVGAFCHD